MQRAKQYTITSKELENLLQALEKESDVNVEFLCDDDAYLFYGDIVVTSPYCTMTIKEQFASTWHCKYLVIIEYN
jgi:hypothetical protein